jgi:hypothetical protein
MRGQRQQWTVPGGRLGEEERAPKYRDTVRDGSDGETDSGRVLMDIGTSCTQNSRKRTVISVGTCFERRRIES